VDIQKGRNREGVKEKEAHERKQRKNITLHIITIFPHTLH
jgi:hypothetical protein